MKHSSLQIDVIIPVYNGTDFIIRALESVVVQTYAPTQIIVVNDGSTDDTQRLVEVFSTKSPITLKIVQKENGGLSSARNAGIVASTSPYVAFLDADDLWYPEKLEQQATLFSSNKFPNLGLVYCKYDVIDKAGVIDPSAKIVPLDPLMRGNAFDRLLEGNKILSSGSGVLIKKGVFDTVGLFDETLRFAEDWDMWLRIAEQYEIDFVDETLVHIRRHGENMTATQKAVLKGELLFYNKWVPRIRGHFPIPRIWKDRITGRIMRRFPRIDFFALPKKLLTKDVYDDMIGNHFKLCVQMLSLIIRKALEKIHG
jgi:glycosyltransferase involved in cell wall biosynthesis